MASYWAPSKDLGYGVTALRRGLCFKKSLAAAVVLKAMSAMYELKSQGLEI